MSLAKNTLIVTCASVIAAAFGYVYNPFLIGRPLGPEGIAVLGVFLSLSQVFSFPQQPLNLTVVQMASKYHADKQPDAISALLRKIEIKLLLFGIPCLFILFLSAPKFADYLNLQSNAPILMAGLFAFVGLYLKLLRATLQGMMQFKKFSLSLIAEPLFRIIIGVAILFAGWGALTAMLGYVISYLATLIICIFFLRAYFRHPSALSPPALQSQRKTWIYSICLAVSLSIDTIIIKHFFSPAEAGFYIAASMLTKMMFVVYTPIAAVSYSTLCQDAELNQKPFMTLLKSLGLLAGCAAVLVTLYTVLAPFIVSITFGDSFKQTSQYLPLTSLAITPFCFTTHISQFGFAKKRYKLFVAGIGIGSLAQAVLMYCFHATIPQAITAYGIGGCIQLGMMILFMFADEWILRRKRGSVPG